jgi:large subunit ribosomal protein L32
MVVPKKHTSMSKKCIRKTIWRKKTYFPIVQSYSLAKSSSVPSGNEHEKINLERILLEALLWNSDLTIQAEAVGMIVASSSVDK